VTQEERLAAFQKMVEQKPDDPFVRYSLGMAYRSVGNSADAAREFQELSRRAPDYVPTYLMLGQALEAIGQTDEAEDAYQRGIAAATRMGQAHARDELTQSLEVLKSQEG
jgi:predicted Zn-dependent protease